MHLKLKNLQKISTSKWFGVTPHTHTGSFSKDKQNLPKTAFKSDLSFIGYARQNFWNLANGKKKNEYTRFWQIVKIETELPSGTAYIIFLLILVSFFLSSLRSSAVRCDRIYYRRIHSTTQYTHSHVCMAGPHSKCIHIHRHLHHSRTTIVHYMQWNEMKI